LIHPRLGQWFIPIEPPHGLLVNALLYTLDPTLTLFAIRSRTLDLFISRSWRRFNDRLLRRLDRNHDSSVARCGFRPACQDSVRFVESSALCPLDCVETKIVAHLRIRAGIYQHSYKVCATEDDGEDEGRLATVGSLVHVRAVSQQSGHSIFVAGSNGVG
jgi:hypothetical protein